MRARCNARSSPGARARRRSAGEGVWFDAMLIVSALSAGAASLGCAQQALVSGWVYLPMDANETGSLPSRAIECPSQSIEKRLEGQGKATLEILLSSVVNSYVPQSDEDSCWAAATATLLNALRYETSECALLDEHRRRFCSRERARREDCSTSATLFEMEWSTLPFLPMR